MAPPELISAPALLPLPRRRATGLGLRVLVVEDDDQIATVLTALLESEGYEVAHAGTAEAGLQKLRAQPFHLLVSDYWLPDRTGAWMLQEASSAGLLKSCRVLVVTAEHRPQGVENLTVLRKPLDLDDFLRNVHDVLAPQRAEELERARQEVGQTGNETDDTSARIALVLYVSASSPSSLKALRNLNALLDDHDRAAVRLTVCDLSREKSLLAEEDRIAFTPTLVKRLPDPKVWILGDLQDTAVVSDLLAQSGVKRIR